MKTLTKEQLDDIKKFETQGDAFLEKDQFEACLSAIDCYATAQLELFKLANELNDGISFNSTDVKLNSWYATLTSKINAANYALANPKLARR